jgi:transcriptional regulator with XRE-family HTH domain
MSNRLKEARIRENLSQEEFGAIAGVSTAQICRFESGERRPRLDEAEKIAARLNLHVSEVGTTEGLTMLSPTVATVHAADLLAEARDCIECASSAAEKPMGERGQLHHDRHGHREQEDRRSARHACGGTGMTCPPDWSAFGLALIGLSALLVAMPLACILWFVFRRTITIDPDEVEP